MCWIYLIFEKKYMYCSFLERMQLTCTAWVESLNTSDDGRGGKIYLSCQKHASVLLLDLLSTGCRLLGVSLAQTTAKVN